MELYTLTVAEGLALLERGELTSEAWTRALLERIEAVEPRIHALLAWDPELALAAAREADARRARGERAPLLGVPVLVKDNLCTLDYPTTCASRILEGYRSPYEATAVRRLREAGAVILGKTNLDEFAMGSSTENSAFGPTRNPWDLERVPGGSSGGSAAAVAAGEAPAALGSDTGGSVRQPAAFCNLVGLKPSYGRVSRYGLVAFASSLDQIGPLTRDAVDAALLLSAIAGPDPADATCAPLPVPDYRAELEAEEPRPLRIGLVREMWEVEGVEPPVRQAAEAALAVLEKDLGCQVREISLPILRYAVAAYYILAPAEASSNLARYDGVKYGPREASDDLWTMVETTRGRRFGVEVRRRIMLGTYALSAGYYEAYYKKSLQVRTVIKEAFDRAFEDVDLLFGLTSPVLPFPLGSRLDDPLSMYLADVFTIPANIAGLPAVSFPGGFVDGLPVGLQLLAPAFQEGRLLRAVHRFQQATDWHRRRPVL